MLKFKTRRRAAESVRVGTRVAAIDAAITALGDEDLLDLADIFEQQPPSPLREMAADEMRKRNLKL